MSKFYSKISLYEILKSFSYSLDLISQTVVGHHNKVAYISLEIGKKMKLSETELKKLVIAALIHDLGVFSIDQTFEDLSFDTRSNQHAELGYQLLKNNFPVPDIAKIIRYHHHEWKEDNKKIPNLSHILHLADRISVLINDDSLILSQREGIENIIAQNQKQRFLPEAVSEFMELSKREDFWLNIISEKRVERKIDEFFEPTAWLINYDQLLDISILISHIIDFRSSFTTTHSGGIAVLSSHLSSYFNFSKKDQKKIKIAGYLHDIGKLVVPPKILNKSESLTKEEWSIMKTHTYYTYQALSTSDQLNTIKEWASFHHEKLNGEGYPFRLDEKDLSLGSRIIAAIDVFTAITENRPYREGMKYPEVKNVLNNMAENKELDKRLVDTIIDNFDEFNEIRKEVQIKTKKYFDTFRSETKKIINEDSDIKYHLFD